MRGSSTLLTQDLKRRRREEWKNGGREKERREGDRKGRRKRRKGRRKGRKDERKNEGRR